MHFVANLMYIVVYKSHCLQSRSVSHDHQLTYSYIRLVHCLLKQGYIKTVFQNRRLEDLDLQLDFLTMVTSDVDLLVDVQCTYM